jgi:serine/threonine protein kinase
MSLTSGTRLGSYEILSLLGAGGMGEVYKARDSKLDREVAIKVLPGAFTHDAERLARLQREAKLLASLNHPNIGSIYGLEEFNGKRFLVLELVLGETVADYVKRQGVGEWGRGRAGDYTPDLAIDEAVRTAPLRERQGLLEVEEALKICRQVAEALQAAHQKGIIHRDLKPANIKITPEGKVKVLDFGLAKAFGTDERRSSDPSHKSGSSAGRSRRPILVP